jgi:hypothetical protein
MLYYRATIYQVFVRKGMHVKYKLTESIRTKIKFIDELLV